MASKMGGKKGHVSRGRGKMKNENYEIAVDKLLMMLTSEVGSEVESMVEGAPPTQNRPAKSKQSVTIGSRGDDLTVGAFSRPLLNEWGVGVRIGGGDIVVTVSRVCVSASCEVVPIAYSLERDIFMLEHK